MEPRLSGFALLLPGGGSSTRFGAGDKLLADLGGLPVFLHSVKTLAPLFAPDSVFMAVAAASVPLFEAAAAKYLPSVRIQFMPGGRTRTESVRILAEAAKRAGRFTHIAIHDAARPLIRPEIVLNGADLCRKTGAALVCHKVTDTLKSSEDGVWIDRTVPREKMWSAETPQMFALDTFLEASSAAERDGGTFTDDSQLVELFSGSRVAIVPDPYPNPKITVAEDLTLCRALLENIHTESNQSSIKNCKEI